MVIYSPGTVFIANVPFEDGRSGKRRPVVLVGNPGYWNHDLRALICPVTTASPRPGVVRLDWRGAGLLQPSCVRPRPIIVPKRRLRWELGAIRMEDLDALLSALRHVLGL